MSEIERREMHREKGHSGQETTNAMVPHQKRSALGRTTALALLGMALLYWEKEAWGNLRERSFLGCLTQRCSSSSLRQH
jgi:hypothetical protein